MLPTAPVKAGERACQGNDAWTLVIAPNGKHLYNMSRQSIACLEIGPRGEPVVKSVTELDAKWAAKDKALSRTLSFTPDGKWLYSNFCLGQPDHNGTFICGTDAWLAIYQRDPATGADPAGGRQRQGFDPAGFQTGQWKGGQSRLHARRTQRFCGYARDPAAPFRRDPNSGRLWDISDFSEWDRRVLGVDAGLWLDGRNGFLYGLGCGEGTPGIAMGAPLWPLWVAKVGRGPLRPQVEAALTGNARPSGAAAEANWPCWRGPTHDRAVP